MSASGAWALPPADINNSGYPSYFLSSMADQRMQLLEPMAPSKPSYHEAQFADGHHRAPPYTGGDSVPRRAGTPSLKT